MYPVPERSHWTHSLLDPSPPAANPPRAPPRPRACWQTPRPRLPGVPAGSGPAPGATVWSRVRRRPERRVTPATWGREGRKMPQTSLLRASRLSSQLPGLVQRLPGPRFHVSHPRVQTRFQRCHVWGLGVAPDSPAKLRPLSWCAAFSRTTVSASALTLSEDAFSKGNPTPVLVKRPFHLGQMCI